MEISVQHHASAALPLVPIEYKAGWVAEPSGRSVETKL